MSPLTPENTVPKLLQNNTNPKKTTTHAQTTCSDLWRVTARPDITWLSGFVWTQEAGRLSARLSGPSRRVLPPTTRSLTPLAPLCVVTCSCGFSRCSEHAPSSAELFLKRRSRQKKKKTRSCASVVAEESHADKMANISRCPLDFCAAAPHRVGCQIKPFHR